MALSYLQIVKGILNFSKQSFAIQTFSNRNQTRNHLGHKSTLDHLAKLAFLGKWIVWLNRLKTKWL